MRALRAMIQKEFVHISRDPQLVGFVLALPVLLLILFGYALRLKVDEGNGFGHVITLPSCEL